MLAAGLQERVVYNLWEIEEQKFIVEPFTTRCVLSPSVVGNVTLAWHCSVDTLEVSSLTTAYSVLRTRLRQCHSLTSLEAEVWFDNGSASDARSEGGDFGILGPFFADCFQVKRRSLIGFPRVSSCCGVISLCFTWFCFRTLHFRLVHSLLWTRETASDSFTYWSIPRKVDRHHIVCGERGFDLKNTGDVPTKCFPARFRTAT